MRVLVDLGSFMNGNPQIVQVERTPVSGAAGVTNINGKFAIPIFKGVDFPVDSTSSVLSGPPPGDVGGRDISSISMAHVLASYPMFGNVYFNPLLTYKHVEEIDLVATWTDKTNPADVHVFPTRIQTGRPSGGPLPAGNMPTHTAILPINNHSADPRPGVLVTNEIDLKPYMVDGAGNFLVYWKLYDFTFTHDVANGPTNNPAIRSLVEPDQEPDGFHVYISPDNGLSWCEVGLLEPMGFSNKTKRIRLAFVNRGNNKVFLATYAVLF